MRNTLPSLSKFAACLAIAVSLSACDKAMDGTDARAAVAGTMYSNFITTWTDAFTYHPPAKPLQPQTRYCYKNMDDIVCYDSVQPTLTAKLVGYQDGQNISWVQQGGGSLGASGGQPVAYVQNDTGRTGSHQVISVKTPIETNPGLTSYNSTGEIQTINLPPRSQ